MTPRTKPTPTLHRVLRGGGWATPVALGVRAVFPDCGSTGTKTTLLGFRTTQKLTRPITKVWF